MIYRIIYESEISPSFQRSDLEQILISSRKNNYRLGITGFLAFGNDTFLQVLEGAESAVKDRFDIISQDNRHTKLTTLKTAFSDTRLFSYWSMSFKVLDSVSFIETRNLLFSITDPEQDKDDFQSLQLLTSMHGQTDFTKVKINEEGFFDNQISNRKFCLFSTDEKFHKKLNEVFPKNLLNSLFNEEVAFSDFLLENDVDIVFIDLNELNLEGYKLCKKIKTLPKMVNVPVVIVSHMRNTLVEEYAFASEADEFISKKESIFTIKARSSQLLKLKDTLQSLAKANDNLNAERFEVERVLDHLRKECSPQKSPQLDYYLTPLDLASGDIILSNKTADGDEFYLLGDFTGHGIIASIGTPIVSNVFNASCERNKSGEAIISNINSALYEQLPTGRFMTCVLVAVHKKLNYVKVWNAGMPPQVYFKDGLTAIDSTFLPLGALSQQAFEQPSFKIHLEENALIIAYTDGFSDAINKNPENDPNPLMLISQWLAIPMDFRPDVKSFTDFMLSITNKKIEDDITVMSIRV